MQAIVRARHEPDLVAVRRLEALLCWQARLRCLEGCLRGGAGLTVSGT